ncbi:PREDICTED: E3 ubiquitin-protein ligase MARCH1-like [Dufourea novaeangliae]|uniref:E3 ubiquitin-protein ligase MARCH1-like n=1 Tax=Dufourea novaeangliae TaxID=178035 RepID=UPI000766F7E9|nr:PREDICTED: E3 ubiquitin-protein ligase MARCH1-like [Dufourea novaeangliae]
MAFRSVLDQPVDKPDQPVNFSGPLASIQSVTSAQKSSTAEQPPRTRNDGTRKCSGRSLADSKGNDDESRGDICRICHMGSFPRPENNRPARERQSQAVRGNDSQISNLSSYAYLGPLISACRCRGSVALVHAVCLERWLTESGHTRCELCGYKYATKRVPRHNIFRSVVIWFNTVIVTRQMLLDILYLVVTTPLALFSCYICALALNMLLKNGLYEIPWMLVAMLPTCTLTLVAYWGWVLTLGRLHGRRWRRYWRNNFVIRLVPDNAILSEATCTLGPKSGGLVHGPRNLEVYSSRDLKAHKSKDLEIHKSKDLEIYKSKDLEIHRFRDVEV